MPIICPWLLYSSCFLWILKYKFSCIKLLWKLFKILQIRFFSDPTTHNEAFPWRPPNSGQGSMKVTWQPCRDGASSFQISIIVCRKHMSLFSLLSDYPSHLHQKEANHLKRSIFNIKRLLMINVIIIATRFTYDTSELLSLNL